MTNTVDKLKQLLFAPESEAIDALTQRIDAVFDRAGTTARFQSSVATVLDGALRDAEVARHEDMAAAIAPLVVRTVKTEIVNSRDELVEVLYPQLGKMLRAFVAAEIKRVTDTANRRLEQNPIMLRINALATGRSVRELALSESQRLTVETVFLIRRATGELIASWPQGGAGSNHDHVMGGVLTAINEFTSEAFGAERSALRQIDLSGSQVYLRVSPTYLLAAKCAGSAPVGVETVFDAEFFDLLERRQATLATVGTSGSSAPDGAALMGDLAQRLEDRLGALQPGVETIKGGIKPLWLLAFLIGLPLMGWLGWNAYVDYRIGQVQRVAREVVAANPEMRGYPAEFRVGQRGRALAISGLAPTAAVKASVIAQLSAVLPDVAIQNELSAVPAGGIDTEPLLAKIKADQAIFEAEVVAKAAARLDQRARRALLAAADSLRGVAGDPGTRAATGQLIADAEAVATALNGPLVPADRAPLTVRAAKIADRLSALAPRTSGIEASLSGPRDEGDALLDAAERSAAAAQAYAALTALEARFKAIPPVVVAPAVVQAATPREQLELFARSHAVFFGDGTAFRDAGATQTTLDELAVLMARTADVLRLVGYTDEAGLPAKNTALARSRADAVAAALGARGVAPSRLIVLGRTAPDTTISPVTGTTSSNRRVEFELGFVGEGQP